MRHRGFTIVELLIVIVVIGILASITVVAYNGVQGNARDTDRLSDMDRIRDALERYRLENGTYPNEAGASWEYSTADPQNFIADLKPYLSGNTPVDPANTASRYYYYYRYEPGTSGWGVTCPLNRGAYYVLGIASLESKKGTDVSSGWNCENGSVVPTNTNWVQTTTRAAWGAFVY